VKILFVGTLQLRKGIQYLLEAKRLLRTDSITIRLVGPSQLSEMALRQLRREVEVVGPVPRSELASHYDWADIFVLPTLSEGAANVCHEAMAAGLPVITTPNAGSIVRDGLDGHIVPIRNAAALCEAIEDLTSNVACRGRGFQCRFWGILGSDCDNDAKHQRKTALIRRVSIDCAALKTPFELEKL
jgi:glycosyltransferase involved in cell wall biosynthesis